MEKQRINDDWKRHTEKYEVDLNNPKDYIRTFFKLFSEKRSRKLDATEDFPQTQPSDYTEFLNKSYQKELEVLKDHAKKLYSGDLTET